MNTPTSKASSGPIAATPFEITNVPMNPKTTPKMAQTNAGAAVLEDIPPATNAIQPMNIVQTGISRRAQITLEIAAIIATAARERIPFILIQPQMD
jgi:hypothetical protein